MFSNYKFRASSAGCLFVEPKSKSEILSETTKSKLEEIFQYEYFGRYEEIESDYLTKGTEVEEQSITLLQEVGNHLILIKNETHFGSTHDYIKGTPDLITDTHVIDIKSSGNLRTFRKSKGDNKMYYYQLQSYMLLTGLQKSTLAYCLVNTPDHLIDKQIRFATYKYELDELPAKIENIKRNNIFDDIPPKQRVKQFSFDLDPTFEERLIEKVTAAREYLNELFNIEENKLAS